MSLARKARLSSGFPWDHPSLKELAERDALLDKRAKGPLDLPDAVRLAALARRSYPPISCLDLPGAA